LILLCFAHCSRERLKQERDDDQQNEKEILDVHLFEWLQSYIVKSLF